MLNLSSLVVMDMLIYRAKFFFDYFLEPIQFYCGMVEC